MARLSHRGNLKRNDRKSNTTSTTSLSHMLPNHPTEREREGEREKTKTEHPQTWTSQTTRNMLEMSLSRLDAALFLSLLGPLFFLLRRTLQSKFVVKGRCVRKHSPDSSVVNGGNAVQVHLRGRHPLRSCRSPAPGLLCLHGLLLARKCCLGLCRKTQALCARRAASSRVYMLKARPELEQAASVILMYRC